MDRRIVQVFYGPGKGKTSAAVGQCIRAASLGQSVIIIQFLKGNDAEEFNFLEKLEPDIKLLLRMGMRTQGISIPICFRGALR